MILNLYVAVTVSRPTPGPLPVVPLAHVDGLLVYQERGERENGEKTPSQSEDSNEFEKYEP